MHKALTTAPLSLVLAWLCATPALSQPAEFTYQGRLATAGLPANGNYDLEFRLYDLASGGTLLDTRTRAGVSVASGLFTLSHDFPPASFPGAARFLEIAVKTAGGPEPYTTLSPRQPISSSPYAVRSLSADTATTATTATDATQLGGLSASGFVQNTTSPQTANFNVSGSGTIGGTASGNVVNAQTQYQIAGSRVLSVAGTENTFVGVGAGSLNTGSRNSFFGTNAGGSNISGGFNAFFGAEAGTSNTTGTANTFFGYQSGRANATTSENSHFGYRAGLVSGASFTSFFGSNAGAANTSGFDNAFFGASAGRANTIGSNNSFFGSNSGRLNTDGFNNAFFGDSAGRSNTSGSDNAFFGVVAGYSNAGGQRNSFFGGGAGFENTTASDNSIFGFEAGRWNNGLRNAFFGSFAGFDNESGMNNAFFGYQAGQTNAIGDNNTIVGASADVGSDSLSFATAIGAAAVVSSSNTIVLGRSNGSDTVVVPGKLQVDTLGVAGATPLCLNGSNRIAPCSSSARYKTNIAGFRAGLSLVNRLRPISFTWKDGGMRDLGFGAEDVEKIEPLLVTYNAKGEVEGVKYDRINVLLVNALKEQQEQIADQQALIRQQQARLDRLEQLLEGLRVQALLGETGVR